VKAQRAALSDSNAAGRDAGPRLRPLELGDMP